MANFHYEWWTVSIKSTTGVETWEFKGKNKENVIRQIKKEVEAVNGGKRGFVPQIVEVYWNTLKLDRIGFQRLS